MREWWTFGDARLWLASICWTNCSWLPRVSVDILAISMPRFTSWGRGGSMLSNMLSNGVPSLDLPSVVLHLSMLPCLLRFSDAGRWSRLLLCEYFSSLVNVSCRYLLPLPKLILLPSSPPTRNGSGVLLVPGTLLTSADSMPSLYCSAI